MRIGLIDVDGHSGFPNLALMKICAFHKAKGDTVDWYDPWEAIKNPFDKVYMSKVFTFTADYDLPIYADEVVRGGTGYKTYDELSDEIDLAFPDYSIYPGCDYAIGFLTRGCIRKCPWCVVPRKEGYIRAYRDWREIKRQDSNKIVFLDNNVLACDFGIEQMESMIDKNVKIDFNQGLDARLVTDETAEIIAKLNWIRFIRFACDSQSAKEPFERAVKILESKGVKPYRIFAYVLIQNVDDALNRIEFVRGIGANPFAQPYRDFQTGETQQKQRQLARWCNDKAIFNTVSWENYKKKDATEWEVAKVIK